MTSTATEADGTLHTWGYNGFGQLGDGTTTDSPSPTQPVDGLGANGGSAPAGFFHTLAVRADGTLAAAGLNADGQLGDGTTTDRVRPVTVYGAHNMTAAATGLWHSVALDDQGRVWTWGDNQYGQLGEGSTSDRHLPTRVYGLPTITKIAAGLGHTVALAVDGTVWTWGLNNTGQLGNGTNTNKTTPIQIPSLSGIVGITAGQNATYALGANGHVYAWGDNFYGQLGDNSNTSSNTPTEVYGITTATKVVAGQVHAYALLTDHSVVAWGYNANDQLGNNNNDHDDSNHPVTVHSITTAVDIAAGGYHGLAALADGTVVAWGDGTFGQLGAGPSTTNAAEPVPVPGLTSITKVDAGALNSAAIEASGTLHAWGYNSNGQVGDGTTTTRFQPVVPTALLDLDERPVTASYKYAPDGLRISKTIGGDGTTGGDATKFVWNRTTSIAGLLTEKTGGHTTSYLYGPDGLPYESIAPDGTVTYLHHDQLGSTRLATSAAGGVVGRATYDPWGNTTATTGDMPNLTWVGEYRDQETGFTYLRARYYDPATAQFLTRDPLEATT